MGKYFLIILFLYLFYSSQFHSEFGILGKKQWAILQVFHSCPIKHSILTSPKANLIFFIKDSFYDFALMKPTNYFEKKIISDKNTSRIEEMPVWCLS